MNFFKFYYLDSLTYLLELGNEKYNKLFQTEKGPKTRFNIFVDQKSIWKKNGWEEKQYLL